MWRGSVLTLLILPILPGLVWVHAASTTGQKVVLAEGHYGFVREDWKKVGQDELKRALNMRPNYNVAKNVILFLGDGMGLPNIAASRIYEGQTKGDSGEENYLEFEKFPHVALAKTYNVDAQGPDSAACATAIVSGEKTNFHTVGVNQYATYNVCSTGEANKADSILDWSLAAGKSVGVVTTTRITHASPASTYGYATNRNWESDGQIPTDQRGAGCVDLAAQLIDQNPKIQVILGGGRTHFMPVTEADPEYPSKAGSRTDGRNLIQEWSNKRKQENKSHSFVWKKSDFDKVDPVTTDYLFGLFEPSHMQYTTDRAQDGAGEPSLEEMVEKAIGILSKNPNGYFLFVEGGRIDHAHHAGLAKKGLVDTIAFSDAIRKATTMTKEEDTLTIATADHSHVLTIGGYPHRGAPVLGFDVKWNEPPLDAMPFTILSYANGPGPSRENMTGVQTDGVNYMQERIVPMEEETHGSEDVAIYARGPMAHLFHGLHEANYIAHVMAYASCVGENKGHCEGDGDQLKCAASDVIPSSVLLFVALSLVARIVI